MLTLPAQVSARARAIHDSAIVIDTHADTPQRFLDRGFDIGDTNPSDPGNISLGKARAGNLTAEFFSIWVDPRSYKGRYAQRALALIDSVYRQAANHPREMTMAFSAADIERARGDRKLAALIGLEGGHSIENSLDRLREFYRRGVRYLTLTWANSNEWADSSGDEHKIGVTHYAGLTDFGRQVVLEMNSLGMMVDISHVSDKTFYDALSVTKAPVIASHSAARVLTHSRRNLTDDMLRAIGANGGVVQVNFFSAFVDDEFRLAWSAREKSIPRFPLNSLIDHIDHVAKVAGIDHVGLGSDFGGVNGAMPQGLDSAADLPKITQVLLERGYTVQDIHKILGANLRHVFRQVERARDGLPITP